MKYLKQYCFTALLVLCFFFSGCGAVNEPVDESVTTITEATSVTAVDTTAETIPEETAIYTQTTVEDEPFVQTLTDADIGLNGVPYWDLDPLQVIELYFRFSNHRDRSRVLLIEPYEDYYSCPPRWDSVLYTGYGSTDDDRYISTDTTVYAWARVLSINFLSGGQTIEYPGTMYLELQKIDGCWRVTKCGTSN